MTRNATLLALYRWAVRDYRMASRQARIDESRFPGIRRSLRDLMDMHEEFAAAKGNPALILDALAEIGA
jgi:hypothetical protein